MESDAEWMQRALALAAGSAGLASPNPQVGCVLMRGGEVLGEGAHLYDAFDHAEIVALKQAAARGHDVRGATAFVTLEPCSHHGRTGPCADALIAAGIARCVVATADPNPEVAGRGLARLRAAGIEVTLGVCEPEARALNNAFAWRITRGRPFVTLKAAVSADGMLAPPGRRTATAPHWLTGPLARAEVQHLRHASDAILTGIGTVLADDPALTDRTGLPRRRPLQRTVLDTHLRLPLDSKLVRSAAAAKPPDLRVFCGPWALPERVWPLQALGIRVTTVPFAATTAGVSGVLDLRRILDHMAKDGINSVLLEAGSGLNAAFLNAGLVDAVVFFYAPHELGPGAIPFARGGPSPFALEQQMLSVTKQPVGPDVRVEGLLHDPWRDPDSLAGS